MTVRLALGVVGICGTVLLFGQRLTIRHPAVHATVRLTEGTNMSATVAPNQSTIVFDLQGTLYSIPMHGGSARRLTDPLMEPTRPDFSPKGDAIAFQSYKGGTFHIWTMKPDGSGVRQLTDGHGDDRDPRFSPDGTKVAFSSDRAFKGSYDVWVVEVSTGQLTQRTSGPEDEYEPAWSPDGSEIAFVSGVGANGTSIQAVNTSGTMRQLAAAPKGGHVNSPSWAPDGKQVAYTQFLGTKSELMVSGSPVMGAGEDVFPFYLTWLSPGRILYTGNGKIRIANVGGGKIEDIPFQAQVKLDRPGYEHKHIDLDSTASKPVTGIVGPTLSPDGKRVLFQALNQIWLMDIGGTPQTLTNDKYYKEDPAWSHDGKQIAYSSDKGGTEDIYILDVATKAEKRVTSSPDSAEVSAAWSPDGKMLAFQNQAGATFVLDLASGQQRQLIPAQFAPSKPAWSANGKTVSISALKPYTRRYREGTSQILSADVATGALTYTEPAPYLSLSTRGEDGPVYSPDGNSVAFVMGSLLWVRPVDKNGIPTEPGRAINNEVTDAPSWSGDSKHLLYLSNGKLRLIGADGSNPVDVPLDLSWTNEAPPARTLVHAGRMWDGRGASVQTNVDILVVNHRIQSITPHNDAAHRAIESQGRYVDASNMTVIPGLWESHTHEWISGKFYGDRLGRFWLAYGVTELQSQGDPVYRAQETRESFGSGERVGPRFFATGEAIDGERVYYNFMRPTYSEAQMDLELARAKGMGYDEVKTYVRLPHEWQKKAVKFAHEQMGVPVLSHYMLPGMAYGMDGMSHVSATARLGVAYTRSAGGTSYSDVRTLYESSGMFVISTPFQSFALYGEDPGMVDDPRLLALNTPWDEIGLRGKRDTAVGKPATPVAEGRGGFGNPAQLLDGLRKEMEAVGAIVRAGGIVLAGTDSPLDNVATALHLNLRAQVKYGLQPWQALQTATLFPSREFGVADDLGTLEPGKLADMALINGNPLQNIKDLANVQGVLKGGKLYTVPELMAPFQR